MDLRVEYGGFLYQISENQLLKKEVWKKKWRPSERSEEELCQDSRHSEQVSPE
jgi:hypothetical protein